MRWEGSGLQCTKDSRKDQNPSHESKEMAFTSTLSKTRWRVSNLKVAVKTVAKSG